MRERPANDERPGFISGAFVVLWNAHRLAALPAPGQRPDVPS
ncbi:hypothetical protein [Arthrobacter sp. CAN_A6]